MTILSSKSIQRGLGLVSIRKQLFSEERFKSGALYSASRRNALSHRDILMGV